MYLARACLSIEKTPLFLETYKDIEEGKYEIYVQFDENGPFFRYDAFKKEGEKHLCFYLFQDKSYFSSLISKEKNREEDLALVSYINKLDASSSEKELIKRYGEKAKKELSIALLDSEQAKSKLEEKEELFKLREELIKEIEEESEVELEFRFSIFSSSISIDIAAGEFSLKPIKDLEEFLSCVRSDLPVSIGGKKIRLSKNNVDEASFRALSLYARRYIRRYRYEVNIEEKDAVSILGILSGKKVQINGEARVLPSIEKGKIHVDEEGKISLEPKLEENSKLYRGNDLLLSYEKEKNLVRLIGFNDLAGERLYEFAFSHKDFPFEDYASFLSSSILPLSLDVDISLPFSEKYPIKKGHIETRCIDNKDGIKIETIYRVLDKEISSHEFALLGPFERKKSLDYHKEMLRLGLPSNGLISQEEEIASFLRLDFSRLAKIAELYIDDSLLGSKPLKMDIRIEKGEDWFALTPFSEDYTLEELAKAISAYQKKKRFVRLKGKLVDLGNIKGREEDLLSSFSYLELGEKLPLYKSLRLPSSYDKEKESFASFYNSLLDYPSFVLPSLPKEIEKEARPYQKIGISFILSMASKGLGGVLADEMGLGKSMQLIGALSCLKSNLDSLIICPKSLLYNWEKEINRWNPELKTILLEGKIEERKEKIGKIKGEKAIYITSYDTLRNDIDLYKGKSFAIVALDEGQLISNPLAKKAKATKEIEAEARFVLTGTPIQNSLMDIWSIFDFILPGYLPAYSLFQKEYGSLSFSSSFKKDKLSTLLSPFLLRREKKDVLDYLPPKVEEVIYLDMEEKQRKAYEAYLALARNEFEDKGIKEGERKIAVLAALTRLRQICVSPSLFMEGDYPSVKFDSLLPYIDNLTSQGHKIIIFSSFKKALGEIGEKLKEKKVDYGFIHGEIDANERVALADRFNKGEDLMVMLASLKAGGVGLNLIGADTVFLLDPWWNLSMEEQASDRAHRIGQSKKVSIFRLVINNSIEEKVLSLQQKKKELNDLFSSDALPSKLSEEDIRFLLS